MKYPKLLGALALPAPAAQAVNVKNTLKNKLLLLFGLLTSSIQTARAAFFGNNSLLPSDFDSAWATVPPDMQNLLKWAVGIVCIVFIAVAFVYTFGSAILAMLSGSHGDISGRSAGFGRVFVGVSVFICVLVAITIVLFLIG